MEGENCSFVTEFIFLGITNNTLNKVTLFIIFLLVYLVNLLANLGTAFLALTTFKVTLVANNNAVTNASSFLTQSTLISLCVFYS